MSETIRMQWALPATRVAAAAMAGLVLVQGLLAGRHLGGEAGALALHETLGTSVVGVAGFLTMVVAVPAFRRSRWRLLAAVGGFAGLAVQIFAGFDDRLDIHVPLGVALFGLYLVIALPRGEREDQP